MEKIRKQLELETISSEIHPYIDIAMNSCIMTIVTIFMGMFMIIILLLKNFYILISISKLIPRWFVHFKTLLTYLSFLDSKIKSWMYHIF